MNKYFVKHAIICGCDVFQVVNRETGVIAFYDKDKKVSERFCKKWNK